MIKPLKKKELLIHTHLLIVRYKHGIIDHKTVVLLEHECQCGNLRQLLRTASKIQKIQKKKYQKDKKILASVVGETDRDLSSKFTWVHNNTPKEILER